MEFLYSFIIGRQTLLDITNNIFNKDRILKVIGAITIAQQTAEYMGWNKQYVFYLFRQIPYIKETIYNKKDAHRAGYLSMLENYIDALSSEYEQKHF